MKLRFRIDQSKALRQGIDAPKSVVTIDINPSSVPEDIRGLIADRMDGIDVCELNKNADAIWGRTPDFYDDSDSQIENWKPNRITAEAPTYEALIKAVREDEKEWERQAFPRSISLSPDQLREMLLAAPKYVPHMVLAGLCGLRSGEIWHLDWSQVNSETRTVEISGSASKTRTKRIVPLCDAALAWLKPHLKLEGEVGNGQDSSLPKMFDAIEKGIKTARKKEDRNDKFNLDRTSLRHSFITYRLAVVDDEAKVASEVGISPLMLNKAFCNSLTPAQGKKWFSVMPTH